MEGADNITSGECKSKAELLQEVEALRHHVSRLEQAEQKLKNFEKQFKELFENTPVGMCRVTPDGRIAMANQTFIRMLGYSSFEELLQLDLEKEGFATGYLHSAFKDLIEKDENVVDREFEWIRRDGTTLFVIKNSRVIRDESGKTLYYEGIVQDITERKSAEERIRILISAVEQSIDGIAIGNVEQKLLYANDVFARMYGYSQEEIIGMPMVKLYDKEQMAEYKRILNRLKKQDSWKGEIGHVRKDGTVFPAYTSVTLLKGDNEETVATLVIVRDITESKQRGKELNIYHEKMVRVEQLTFLGTLIAALSNKLTQPLTVARLSIENSLAELNAVSYSGEAVEELNAGLGGISNIASVVEQFGMFAKETSKNKVKRVDLKTVAERILQFLEERAWRAEITMLLQKVDRLPPIYSYEKDLEQLFFALAENAIEAAGGEKDCQLTISGAVKDENIELRFSDNCGGIAPEILDRIFEPFFTTKAASKATGLGLCTVQHIVSKARGNIRVENRPGEGSTFIITLPIRWDDKY